MNEEKDEKPPVEVQEFSPTPAEKGDGGSSFWRGCFIALGVVALIFFLIVGTCFIQLSRW